MLLHSQKSEWGGGQGEVILLETASLETWDGFECYAGYEVLRLSVCCCGIANLSEMRWLRALVESI